MTAVQLGGRIRTSVSRIDESTREETSVNAKPNDPLRMFHEAALNYEVDITKTDPAVSWWLLWQTKRNHWPDVRFCERFQIQTQCTLRQIAEPAEFPDFGGPGHGEAPRGNFFFLLKTFSDDFLFASLDLLPDCAIIRLSTDSPVLLVRSG